MALYGMARREHRDMGLLFFFFLKLGTWDLRCRCMVCFRILFQAYPAAVGSVAICGKDHDPTAAACERSHPLLADQKTESGCRLCALYSLLLLFLQSRVFIHAQTPNRTRHPNPNPITTRLPRRPKSGGEAPASGSSDDGLLQLQLQLQRRRPGCRRRGRRPRPAPRQRARRLHQPRSLRLCCPQKVLTPLAYPRRSQNLLPARILSESLALVSRSTAPARRRGQDREARGR